MGAKDDPPKNLPTGVEWLISSFDGPSREIILKVLRPEKDSEGKTTNVAMHTETVVSTASNEFLSLCLKQLIEQLQQIEQMYVLAKNADVENMPFPKLFAIYVSDVQLGISCWPVILPGAASDTVETFRSRLIGKLKETLNTTSVYHRMIAEVERRGWRFGDLRRGEKARERWREVCTVVHPFWLTEMTEIERGEFARRSHDTILKNLRTGRFKSNNFERTRTARLTSSKGPDKITRVRKSTKKS